MNTLTLLPSLLACASLKAAMKGLRLVASDSTDAFMLTTMRCKRFDLLQCQGLIEQVFQSCLQGMSLALSASPTRRCLVPIDASTRQRTKVR
jgi:hypothetical protein